MKLPWTKEPQEDEQMHKLGLLHNFFQVMARKYHKENCDSWIGYANAARWIDEYMFYPGDLVEDLEAALEENGMPKGWLENPFRD